MSTAAIVIIVVLAVIVVGLVAVFAIDQARRRRLQSRFGAEYDHTLESSKDRKSAERELIEREKQHKQLTLKPLSTASRERYTQQWAEVQEHFVDSPDGALEEADELVTALMTERGYPTGEFDERAAHLSVEHGNTIGHYRTAHDIMLRHRDGETSTEDLRTALLHYRSLVHDLLKVGDTEQGNGTDRRTERV